MASINLPSYCGTRLLVSAFVLVAVAAISWTARAVSSEAGTDSRLRVADAAIDARDFLHHIEVLSSDDFEGRAPGTHGEALAVSYLEQQLKSIGLLPGNPDGSYTQRVPMTGFTGNPEASITIGARRMELRSP